MTSPRRKKFVELAEKRTQRAIDFIQLLGNLSSTRNYEYTDADVKKILGALNSEIRALKEKFSTGEDDKKSNFKL
ncbi:hypothetical protein N9F41_00205 [bacterium]|jgi:hypothetical protein|nr:hypothetical protein [bacterium]MDB4781144.1 hypothetical protein [Akkermansiaceae bacterium]